MSQNSESVDYLTISKNIYKKLEEHECQLKENCIKSSIIPLSDFYEGYQREIDRINSEVTPRKDKPTISDYADIFKAFEEYPPNLQKPRRAPPKDLLRMNSTIAPRDMTMLPNTYDLLPSAQAAPLASTSLSSQKTATEIYKDFKKFKQTLNQFLQEAQDQHITSAYAMKLQQLTTFAKQLEKLRPTAGTSLEAFTPEEATKLRMILRNLEDLNYIQDNSKILTNVDVSPIGPRTESIAQLITYLLSAVSIS